MKKILLGIIGNDKRKEDIFIIDALNYILYKGITNARFDKFIIRKHIYKDLLYRKIIRLGNNSIEAFNKTFDLNVKEEEINYKYAYCIDTGKVTEIDLSNSNYTNIKGNLKIYTNNELKYIRLEPLYKYYCNIIKTNIDWFDWDIKDIRNATNKALSVGYAIVTNIKTDQIELIKTNESLYGGVIKIESENNIRLHAAPNFFYIDRNDSRVHIFYKLIDIVSKINKQL